MTTAYWLGDSATEVDQPHRAGRGLRDRGRRPARPGRARGRGERVGERGRVVGLDLEPRLLAVTGELAGDHDVELVEANAAASGLPAGAFDLVHERAVLLNLTDPAPVVAEMVRLARPGGTVALQEPDAAAWLCDPPHSAFERLKAELLTVYERMGRDFHIGRRAGRLLRDAGLHDVEVRATARVTRPGDYHHSFLLTLCGLLGVSAAEDTAALREHLGRPDTITCQPLLWQATGVRP